MRKLLRSKLKAHIGSNNIREAWWNLQVKRYGFNLAWLFKIKSHRHMTIQNLKQITKFKKPKKA